MTFMFENLEVYQKAVDLADEIAALCESFPRGYGFLVDQLNRAVLSTSTNLAEGNGRFTPADRRHFFVVARGSTQEFVPVTEVARRRGLIADSTAANVKHQLEVIAKMISGLISGLDNRET
jgi:four helix bundle protein